MMFVGKRSSGTTLLSGSGLGKFEPFSVAAEYLSPNPLTYTYFPLTKLRPVRRVSAPSSGTGTIGGGTSTVVKNGTCPEGTETTEAIVAGNTFCAISGTIESDLTLTDDVYYTLVGRVDVGIDIGGDGNKAGGKSATLTIPAGVSIASKTASDFLQINRGSKIMAEGTVSNPIIFTSSQKLDGTLTNSVEVKRNSGQ